ncbi:hypothetical protein OMP38_09015 [Cohnella ginsengisoli]|uniref:PqqD family protein n=1 Tax=Cohnella ginsengisoli TaxID=425004 RepID=A0A9X4KF94_9BACL|nr:hypothetical protein [Cohnella ginsengisoli]MDG0790992.1 hypothetical protein [Cohnella ginsengisoli]
MEISLSICSKVCLSHLSIQKEGNEYTIGDPNIPRFIRVPEAAVLAVKNADGLRSIEEIRTKLKRDNNVDVDVLDFFSKLLAIGFVKSVGDLVLVSDPPPLLIARKESQGFKTLFQSINGKMVYV